MERIVNHLRSRMNIRRYSRRTCGRSWTGRQCRKRKKREQNELAMSSRTHPVTHLPGPPTSQVAPLYLAPIQQSKAGPHPSVGGRGSQPRFHVEEKERRGRQRQRQRWWWEISLASSPFVSDPSSMVNDMISRGSLTGPPSPKPVGFFATHLQHQRVSANGPLVTVHIREPLSLLYLT